jgi:pyruvate/2-oxoglutarate dehydrogenase complex dihydrolipoamide acyltransferase (E2) component
MSAKRIPFAGVRKAISERLSPGFHQALPVALMTEFYADNLLAHRASAGKPSFTAYGVKAVALALKKYPEMNITLEGGEIVYHEDINIAVGVNTPKGLRAPVIRNADQKTLREITLLIDEFAEKGKKGEITLADQEGHSFTVTNLGMMDVKFFTPILNPPDCFILGIGRIEPRLELIISDSGDEKIVKKMMGNLTLVFDHRVVDGMPASRLLAEIKRLLENPNELE